MTERELASYKRPISGVGELVMALAVPTGRYSKRPRKEIQRQLIRSGEGVWFITWMPERQIAQGVPEELIKSGRVVRSHPDSPHPDDVWELPPPPSPRPTP